MLMPTKIWSIKESFYRITRRWILLRVSTKLMRPIIVSWTLIRCPQIYRSTNKIYPNKWREVHRGAPSKVDLVVPEELGMFMTKGWWGIAKGVMCPIPSRRLHIKVLQESAATKSHQPNIQSKTMVSLDLCLPVENSALVLEVLIRLKSKRPPETLWTLMRVDWVIRAKKVEIQWGCQLIEKVFLLWDKIASRVSRALIRGIRVLVGKPKICQIDHS